MATADYQTRDFSFAETVATVVSVVILCFLLLVVSSLLSDNSLALKDNYQSLHLLLSVAFQFHI